MLSDILQICGDWEILGGVRSESDDANLVLEIILRSSEEQFYLQVHVDVRCESARIGENRRICKDLRI